MSRIVAALPVLLLASTAHGAAPYVPDGPPDDPLPAGARARLGTLRFNGEVFALSPDGAVLARGTPGKVFLTDVRTGRNLREWPVRPRGVRELRFVDGGRMLVAANNRDVALERILAQRLGSPPLEGSRPLLAPLTSLPPLPTISAGPAITSPRAWHVSCTSDPR
jgi:hypothetical protein